jgi:hypothetical protein
MRSAARDERVRRRRPLVCRSFAACAHCAGTAAISHARAPVQSGAGRQLIIVTLRGACSARPESILFVQLCQFQCCRFSSTLAVSARRRECVTACGVPCSLFARQTNTAGARMHMRTWPRCAGATIPRSQQAIKHLFQWSSLLARRRHLIDCFVGNPERDAPGLAETS